MRPRLQLCALLFAWFMATGSQWDLVQVFAWGRMFAGYAREMPVVDALRLTFKPDNLCSICRAVKAAKQEQDQSPATTYKDGIGKILLVFAPVPAVVVAPAPEESWPAFTQFMLGAGRAAPPTPPPRNLAA
jgi:hypothetical protein